MQIYPLLLSLVFFTSCNGQVKNDLPKDSPDSYRDEPKTITDGQPKIVKTQGTNQYANTRCGLQDKAGNLWFGTTGEGVYRYDGKLFTQYTVKDGLSNNTVECILEDKSGNIWFGTDAGLCRYDGKTMISIPISVTNGSNFYLNNSQNNSPSEKNGVWSMLQDKSGRLWFCAMEGVYSYNGTSFTHFLDNDGVINKDSLDLKAIGYLLEDKSGNIWFGSGIWGGDGICRYDGKSITSFKPNGDGWIRYIVEDKNGIIWFGTRHNGNWRYDGKTFAKYTEKVGIGAPALVDNAGNIWFTGEEHENGYGGAGGIWRYDGKSYKNFTTKDGMGNYGVWCIVEDRAGNIWFGTRNNGLYRYDGKIFTSFSE
ncbi:MAG TPA: two-component regulator propeller domain-containing protein [Chitinophagales bacterium]|nr:two-component regulator propeller domain-containing protein [Chitinophagales bacterium]